MEPAVDPWTLELIVVRASQDGRERVALSRDAARGLLLRLRRGVYVERAAFEQLGPEGRHLVRMRAFAAAAPRPVAFSHWSAAVAHRLPVMAERLQQVHVAVADRAARNRDGVVGHLLPATTAAVERVGPFLVTPLTQTVVDLALAAPFEEGVIAADGALRAGLPRSALEEQIERAAGRKGLRRAAEVVGFAHPGAEGAAESRSRTTLCRIGVEPPVLQHPLVLRDGSTVFLDIWFPSFDVGGEVDGAVKFLDPVMAPDARRALWHEKRREDEVRLRLRGLARWGWVESGSTSRLADVLRQVGVVPASPRAVLADYVAAARDAVPRFRAVHR